MKRTILFSCIMLMLVSGASFGQCSDASRIEKLEQQVSALSHSLEEKRDRTPDIQTNDKESPGEMITKKISFSGLLEVEGAFSFLDMVNGEKTRESDIALATVEISIEAAVTEKVRTHIHLLWEEDTPGSGMEKVDIDEGIIEYDAGTFEFTAGRFYMPFGMFYSSFINDPLTLELGETQESGVAFQFQPSDSSDLFIGLANGNVSNSTAGSNTTDFGVGLFLHPMKDGENTLDIGFQYYSDMADTDAEITGGTMVSDTTGAVAANLEYATPKWTFNFELVGAESRFPVALDNNADGFGDRPTAWNAEVSTPVSEKLTVAFKYEKSDEFMDFPKTRVGVVGSWELDENVLFDLEYLYDTYDQSFTSTGVSNAHTITTKLSAGF